MAIGPQHRPPVLPAKAGSGFRPDIQGLRAVAVSAVILDHLFGWPAGGYIGVDVFFVISGYLITSLMLREHQRTGAISWTGFYRRRIKRIVPASTVCVLVTVVAAYFLLEAVRFRQAVGDALWSLLLASNWHLAVTESTRTSSPSPLSHIWSLSVEEQFYFVWPILLIAALGVTGRQWLTRKASINGWLLTATVVVAALSFGWAILETADNYWWAYLSTFSRAWELAVGAILAVSAAKLFRITAGIRSYLFCLGLLAVGASLFVIPPSGFPAPWAALPVAGAALVIAAGIGGTSSFAWPLTNPASVYVGKISYSLYLWHLPVIVLLASVIQADTFEYFSWAIIGIVVASVASFHLVEDPVRSSAWFEPDRTLPDARTGGRSKGRMAWSVLLGAWVVSILILVMLVAGSPS